MSVHQCQISVTDYISDMHAFCEYSGIWWPAYSPGDIATECSNAGPDGYLQGQGISVGVINSQINKWEKVYEK